MYPLKFEPLLKSMVWGGNKIMLYKGIESAVKNTRQTYSLNLKQGEIVLVPASIECISLIPNESMKNIICTI